MRIYHGVVYYKGVEYATIAAAVAANRCIWEMARMEWKVKLEGPEV